MVLQSPTEAKGEGIQRMGDDGDRAVVAQVFQRKKKASVCCHADARL